MQTLCAKRKIAHERREEIRRGLKRTVVNNSQSEIRKSSEFVKRYKNTKFMYTVQVYNTIIVSRKHIRVEMLMILLVL